AEERAVPIYVLKSNTIPQMQSSLTSIFSLEIDPREAAMRETEDAIESVLSSSEAVELSPQNAYIRRLQHQMAERANLVSRSRGREPYRRVRLYPDAARSGWRYPVLGCPVPGTVGGAWAPAPLRSHRVSVSTSSATRPSSSTSTVSASSR